jgi:hypothetical protein
VPDPVRQVLDPNEESPEVVFADDLYRGYFLRAKLAYRFIRAFPVALIQLLLGLFLMWWIELPLSPARGPVSRAADYTLFLMCFTLTVFLMAMVLDTARFCRAVLERLGDGQTIWPRDVLNREAAKFGLDRRDLDGRMDVILVAATYTERVGQMVYYPFLVLVLLIAGQNRFFDDWNCSLPLAVVIGVIVGYSVYCAVIIRKSAERLRKAALERLDRRISESKGEDFRWSKPVESRDVGWTDIVCIGNYSKKLTRLRKEIAEEKRGAFAPLLMDPAIGAVIFSAVGTGLTFLIQYLQGGH